MAHHTMAGLLIVLKESQPFIDLWLSSGLTGQEQLAYHYLFNNHPQGCSGG